MTIVWLKDIPSLPSCFHDLELFLHPGLASRFSIPIVKKQNSFYSSRQWTSSDYRIDFKLFGFLSISMNWLYLLFKKSLICFILSKQTVDQLHVIYPEVLKRMDDSSDQIRIFTTKTLSAFFKWVLFVFFLLYILPQVESIVRLSQSLWTTKTKGTVLQELKHSITHLVLELFLVKDCKKFFSVVV